MPREVHPVPSGSCGLLMKQRGSAPARPAVVVRIPPPARPQGDIPHLGDNGCDG